MKKKVLVIGGSSFLGLNFLERAREQFKLYATYHQHQLELPGIFFYQLDLTNKTAVQELLSQLRPEVVVLFAAISQTTGFNKELLKKLNVEGTSNLVGACQDIKAKLIFLSTDYLFDGKDGPYRENDLPNPLQEYGRTKLQGEKLVSSLLNHAIVRTCLVYGQNKSFQHPNFVTILNQKNKKGEKFTVFTDMYRTPTYVEDVSEAISLIIEQDKKGIYHASSRELISMEQFAEEVCSVFQLDKRLLTKITSAGNSLEADKPKRAGLNPERTEEALGCRFSSVAEGLQLMKSTIESNND